MMNQLRKTSFHGVKISFPGNRQAGRGSARRAGKLHKQGVGVGTAVLFAQQGNRRLVAGALRVLSGQPGAQPDERVEPVRAQQQAPAQRPEEIQVPRVADLVRQHVPQRAAGAGKSGRQVDARRTQAEQAGRVHQAGCVYAQWTAGHADSPAAPEQPDGKAKVDGQQARAHRRRAQRVEKRYNRKRGGCRPGSFWGGRRRALHGGQGGGGRFDPYLDGRAGRDDPLHARPALAQRDRAAQPDEHEQPHAYRARALRRLPNSARSASTQSISTVHANRCRAIMARPAPSKAPSARRSLPGKTAFSEPACSSSG